MRKEENDCIRYLMKEMDPSEELLMERAMMEDENLLIEVESMRQTLQKLNKLPELDPPPQVTNNILAKASEHADEERYSFIYKPVFKYAAAVLALIISAGGAWVYFGTIGTSKSGEQEARVSAIISQSPQVQPQNTTDLQFKGTGMQAVSSVPQSENDVEPWVDRNNILRFQDQFLSNSRNFEAILKNSTKKLQLIDTPVNAGQRVKSIQLTGN